MVFSRPSADLAVIIVVPAETPFTIPFVESTVAISEFELLHVTVWLAPSGTTVALS